MVISYPRTEALTLDPAPSRLDLNAVDLNTISRSSFTGQTQVTLNPGVGYWTVNLAFPPMTRENAMKWIGLFRSVYGAFGSLVIPMYFQETALGSLSGTPVCNGITSAPSTSVPVRGMGANDNGVILAGSLINIGSFLYRVVLDLASDASGNGVMEIWPALRADTADGLVIQTSFVSGTFKQDPSFTFNESINAAQHWGFGWDGIEAY